MRLLSSLFSLCLLACTLSAAIITSGSITVVNPIASDGAFTFNGVGFSLTGVFSGGLMPSAQYSPGTFLSVNGGQIGNDIGAGYATVGGTNFPSLNWGSLNAAGSSVLSFSGPPILLNHGAGSYSGTFAFTGALCGTDFAGGGNCLVQVPSLIGVGTVDVTVAATSGPRVSLFADKFVYTFTSGSQPPAATVPEPASALLIMAAIALLALLPCRVTRGIWPRTPQIQR